MNQMSYTDFINCYQNEDTIKVIGKIDTDILKSNKIESLFYGFPLIEKIILEIYKLEPEASVEQNNQGIMRTINSIIEENKELNVLPLYITKLIEKYFRESGLRNQIFHINCRKRYIKVDFNEINFLIMKIFKILKDKLGKFDKFEFKNIDYLK